MTIPESEIARDEQDQLRVLLTRTGFDGLHAAQRDAIVRMLHRRAANQALVGSLRVLLERDDRGQAAGLPSLAADEQDRVLGLLDASTGTLGTYGLRLAVDEIARRGVDGDVKRAALDVVTLPITRVAESSDPALQRRLRARWFAPHDQRMVLLAQTLRHATFAAMSVEDRCKAIRVVGEIHRDGMSCFLELFEPLTDRWRAGGASSGTAPIRSGDSGSGSLIGHLGRLALGTIRSSVSVLAFEIGAGADSFDFSEAAVVPRFNADDADGGGNVVVRSRVLSDLVCEVARPDQYVNQHDRNTCSITAVLHRLAWQQPAEYARMAVDFLIDGSTALRNGETASPSDDAFASDASTRSASERLTQSAMMRYGRADDVDATGQPVRYFNVRPHDSAGPPGADLWSDRQFGMHADDLLRVANAVLLGGPFRAHFDRATIPTVLAEHFRRRPHQPVLVGMGGLHVVDVVRVVSPRAALDVALDGVLGRSTETPPEPGAWLWNPAGAALVAEYAGFPIRVNEGAVAPPSAGVVGSAATYQLRTVDDSRALQFMAWPELCRIFFDIYLPADEP